VNHLIFIYNAAYNYAANNCDTTEATKVVNLVIVLPLFMFGVVIICTNTYVYRVAQRHARQIADIQRRIVFIWIFFPIA